MADTVYSRARDSFARLKTAFAGTSTQQSEYEIIFDPPGLQRIKVRFEADPANPMLHIVKEGKPNLAPDLHSGEPPEVETQSTSFNAFFDGADFGWVSSNDLERPRNNQAIESLISVML